VKNRDGCLPSNPVVRNGFGALLEGVTSSGSPLGWLCRDGQEARIVVRYHVRLDRSLVVKGIVLPSCRFVAEAEFLI
jgi:hypothetical protein